MNNNLSALEEFDAQRKIQFPHLLYSTIDLRTKRNSAYSVLLKKENEILLISPSGFGESSVVAGLTEKNIEYFSKFAPKEYREQLMSVVGNSYLMEEVWEIIKLMDEDDGQIKNKIRMVNVVQYIRDNKIVFQF